MNSCIDEKIKSLIAVVQKPFQNVLIRIECPLDSGIKVECWRDSDGVKNAQIIPGGVRPFFKFVEQYRNEEPGQKFNVINISVEPSEKYTVCFIFDEDVQREAEENIKQE